MAFSRYRWNERSNWLRPIYGEPSFALEGIWSTLLRRFTRCFTGFARILLFLQLANNKFYLKIDLNLPKLSDPKWRQIAEKITQSSACTIIIDTLKRALWLYFDDPNQFLTQTRDKTLCYFVQHEKYPIGNINMALQHWSWYFYGEPYLRSTVVVQTD